MMELYDSDGIHFDKCDFFNNREYELITNRGCENTIFNDCRFYANWGKAPLFMSDSTITLFGCEVYHSIIGDRDQLIWHECRIENDSEFVPDPREHPIGPDVEE